MFRCPGKMYGLACDSIYMYRDRICARKWQSLKSYARLEFVKPSQNHSRICKHNFNYEHWPQHQILRVATCVLSWHLELTRSMVISCLYTTKKTLLHQKQWAEHAFTRYCNKRLSYCKFHIKYKKRTRHMHPRSVELFHAIDLATRFSTTSIVQSKIAESSIIAFE